MVRLKERKYVSPSRHPYIQRNYEVFRDTFQKPSQIYKFLKQFWKQNPPYLNRTLSYVRIHRNQSRSQSKRQCNRRPGISFWDTLHRNKQVRTSTISQTDLTVSVKRSPKGIDQISESPVECYFNWICDDPSRMSQKTRTFGYTCPWCETDYRHIDSLMFHLKCCHSRFNFNLVEEDEQAVIEIVTNPSFDGSYCGFKYPGHDLRRDFKFRPNGPQRRTPFSQVLFFRAKRRSVPKRHLGVAMMKSGVDDENFASEEGEADIDVCSGRLYYHTTTCLPIKPNELDLDSEADMDPEWLQERTQLMIDEFTDVNEGEKEIMKMWNLHIMRNYKYKSDAMVPQACLDFVESEGQTIMSRNLYKNFILHLANLFDYGLIGSRDLVECVQMLKKQRVSPKS